MKTCNRCDKPARNGSLCRKHYNEYMKSYMLDRYYRRREVFIKQRGGVCELCGDNSDLEIDHIIAEDKKFNLGKALSGWAQNRIDEELKKCQVLCKKCHARKTREDNARIQGIRKFWEHGTVSGYRHCKCDLCKAARNSYVKEYRLRKKSISVQ